MLELKIEMLTPHAIDTRKAKKEKEIKADKD